MTEGTRRRKALVAVDLGAQSCRVSLLRWHGSEPAIEVVHRSANGTVHSADQLHWDVEAILVSVLRGLQICAARAPEGIASIAVDGWAVDYVRLGADGLPVAPPFCYRDPRNERSEQEVHAVLSPQRLYCLTGIQILRINTVYQLYADKLAGADPQLPWLNLPEYVAYRLCGKRFSEYTMATHTGLVDIENRSWCEEIFCKLGLSLQAAPQIVPCGTILGNVTGNLAQLPAFRETQVIAAACHDTAAAIAGIPAQGDDWAFISSGTWSLVGTLLDTPCVSDEARSANFTNLGGAGGKYCFLKNVNGTWLLQQCIAEWERHGFRANVQELQARCATLPPPPALIDVDDPPLLAPGNMIAKINAQLAQAGHPEIAANGSQIPETANLIFHSMAARYADVLAAIRSVTGKTLRRLFIVGGGSQNELLNRLTAQRSGLQVILGSVESTSIGNFAVQLAALAPASSASRGASGEVIAQWAARLAEASFSTSQERRR